MNDDDFEAYGQYEKIAPDAAAARVLTCVYCSHEYPQATPAHGDKVLTDHIAVCEKHPMRNVIEQRDRLRAALAALVGASTRQELAEIETGMRLMSGGIPNEDMAAMLNAIHALRDTLPEATDAK